MDYLNAFWVGGLICALVQILMEKTKMMPGRIMVLLVCLSIAAVRLLRSSNARPLGQNYSTVTTPTQEPEEQPDNAD